MKNESVYLRALEAEDIEKTHAWHNDRDLYESLGRNFKPVSRSAEKAWLEDCICYRTEQLCLAICLKETHEHIGNIYLRNIEWTARHGEMNILIGSAQHRGQGLGASALKQLISLAFGEMNLNRIYLHVLKTNEAAIKMYEKTGFRQEGCLVQHAYKNGQYEDMLVMGLCRDSLK